MRLQPMSVLRQFLINNFSCQEHPACLPAHRSASDHTISELKIIFWMKIFSDPVTQPPVLCHRTLDYLNLCLLTEFAPLVLHLCQCKKAVVTVIILILVLFLLF